jgi:hypothetical protein
VRRQYFTPGLWANFRGRAAFLFCLCLPLLLLTGCNPPGEAHPPRQLGAWLVYWEAASGLSELASHGHLFQQVSLFAYELDEAGHPRPAPGLASVTPRFLELAKNLGFQPWLTVVNDVRHADGKITLKDNAILQLMLQTPDTRLSHVQSLIHTLQQHGFAGLTLDYEGLEPDQQGRFGMLITELSRELARAHLGFNVILEPRRGPLPPPGTARVTVMAYNLHGPHSGPGPRATPEFIASLSKRGSADDSGCPAIALAVGGFIWPSQGRTRKLSWSEAPRLAQRALEVGRSSPAGVPFARFRDGAQMWFEDSQSLTAKWRAASRAGYCDLWLWHLGGNDERLFDWLRRFRPAGLRN